MGVKFQLLIKDLRKYVCFIFLRVGKGPRKLVNDENLPGPGAYDYTEGVSKTKIIVQFKLKTFSSVTKPPTY